MLAAVARIGITCSILVASPSGAADAPPAAFFTALRAADLRVAAIAYRLTTANAALCGSLQPQLGMPLHALGQYGAAARAAADAAFDFETAVAVEAVVPGAPAAAAGVEAGDSLVAINGASLPAKPTSEGGAATADQRIAADDLIAAAPPSAPIALVLRRDGVDRTIDVQPKPGCRTGVEMVLDDDWDAEADGGRIRVAARFLERFDDAQIAVVMAHELAHNILRHRARLDVAKVKRGMLGEFGRNARLIRQTENEADRLSVYLLYNAGYDPSSAARFWREDGERIDGGLFRSHTHAPPSERAARLAAEAALIAPGTPRPLLPAMLALRDQPLR